MEASHALTKLLWYKTPAENWQEALPIGNGRIGAMIYGGINREVISLNEDSIWAGYPLDRHNPKALKALPKIRRLIFEGKNEQASELAEESIVSNPRHVFPYQPLGDLIIESRFSKPYTDYRRELDLSNGIAKVKWRQKEAVVHREYFVSAPDQVVVVRYTCDQLGMLTLVVRMSRAMNASSSYIGNDTILFEGFGHEKGIHFSSALRVVTDGGSVAAEQWRCKEGATLYVTNANTVTFYLTTATDFRTKEPTEKCISQLEKVVTKGYTAVKESHIADYKCLFDRFDLDIWSEKTQADIQMDTAQRLEAFCDGQEDHHLFALLMNYNRYLLIAASRPGCLPSNLQGIWNHRMMPPWESDFHTNINFQINYWPVEGYHLSECHEPMFEWLEALTKTGQETARRIYGVNGWVLHHCTDLWGNTAPTFGLLGIWPMGGLWCCRDLYDHYTHTGDLAFVKKYYPVLRGAIEFILDFLIEAPEGTPWEGYLVTNPSHSPENRFYAEDKSEAYFTWCATMDIEIIRDLSYICIEFIDLQAKDKPDFDAQFRQRILDMLKRLPPIQISKRTGGIQEWINDYEEVDAGHRHVSHLYACYPGTEITPEKTPELAQAVRRSILHKYEHNYDSQGWSIGWIACIWARLYDAEEAYRSLSVIVKKHLLYNLFVNAHGNPQVGDEQVVPAAMLEMLAQSHNGVIRLLPALPKQWANGFVRGFKLRGGHELTMEWEDGKLKSAYIYSSPDHVDMPILYAEEEKYTVTQRDNVTFIIRK